MAGNLSFNKIFRFSSHCLLTLILLITLWSIASPPPQPVSAKPDDTWIRPETLSAGFYHACAIQNDGQLVCWGDNTLRFGDDKTK